MYRFILLFFYIFTSLLYSQDLDNLLRLYESESELSKKTKDENAGSLVIFTRDELERMQVETLKDVLKSTRYFRYFENRLSDPDLLNADPIAYSSKSIKIYLNDTELFLPIYGTGMPLFGNIDMDFIDHVEIYEGFPSFEYAINPALIIIKLYTKTAQKDAGSRVKLLVANHNSNKENVYTSDITEDDLAYFIYANHSENMQDTYKLSDETLKRDSHTNHFYASFEKHDTKLELNLLKKEQKSFLGELPFAVPREANKDYSYINATLSQKFLDDKSLSFALTYQADFGTYTAEYSQPVPFDNYTTTEQNSNSNVLSLITKKEFIFDSHSFTIGIQYRHKYFDFDDIKYDDIKDTTKQVYSNEDIYSLFLEESLYLTKNDLLGISLMGQYYDRNKDMKSEQPLQVRFSYIKSLEELVSKTFLSRQEFIPEPYMTAITHTGNPNLNPEIYSSIIQEFRYETSNILSKLILAYTDIDGFLISDSTGVIQNSKRGTQTYAASVELTYHFRKTDQFDIRAETLKLYGTDMDIDAIHTSYIFRMLNSVAQFDIFNELIINAGYTDVEIGYDYSAGIKYAFTPDVHIAFKGENIFNTGLKRKYIYSIAPTLKQLSVPVVEQKFMLSLEYLF